METWIDHLEALEAAADALARGPLANGRERDELLALILAGQEVGMAPVEAVAKLFVKDGRVDACAETMRALARRAGHMVEVRATGHNGDSAVEVSITRADGTGGSTKWDMGDAERLGLASVPCWRTRPRQMLTARCSAEAVRAFCSEVLGPIAYTPEEGEEIARSAGPRSPETRSAPADSGALGDPDDQGDSCARASADGVAEIVGWFHRVDALAAHAVLVADAKECLGEDLDGDTRLARRLREVAAGELLDRDRFGVARGMVDELLADHRPDVEPTQPALSVVGGDASAPPPAERAAALAERLGRGRRCA